MTRSDGLPSGTVVFLFTDVVGSTRMWAHGQDEMSQAMQQHDDLVRHAIESRRGYVFTTAGDAFAAAFASADDAVDAAVAVQSALNQATWPTPEPVRVRVGLHAGNAVERAGDYFGPVLNTAARVEASAHPGQILATAAVDGLSSRTMGRLGSFRLRDIEEPVELFQVGDGAFSSPRTLDGAVSTLPATGSRLIGRISDVADVRRLLHRSRLVTITGVGGCGKTRLAIEVAGRELPTCNGVFFVDLTTVADPEGVPSAAANGVGLTLAAVGSPTESLVRYLADRDALVVVDNCEHLVDAVAELVEILLSRCPSIRVLATSREALELAGEQTWRIPSLSTAPGSAGFQLFVERASERDASFAPTQSDADAIAEICAALDGIPLAIELAAARTLAMSVQEVRSRLDDRFRLLGGGRRRRSRQRQQTLESTVRWSYDLLDGQEQEVLRQLAVFSGGFDPTDVATMMGISEYPTLDLIEGLVAKSLVDRHVLADGRSRLRLLETIRLFAMERLAEEGGLIAARDAHCDLYLAHPIHASAVANYSDPAALRRQLTEVDNITAAIDWAIETNRTRLAALGVARNAPALNMTGRGHDYLDVIRGPHPDASPAEQATLAVMGVNLSVLGFVGEELLGDPGKRAREIVEAGHVDDDVLTAVAVADFYDPDASLGSCLEYLELASSHSELSESQWQITAASFHLRERQLDHAILALRRALHLTPQSRVGASAAVALCLLLAATGRHPEADAVVRSLQPVPGSFSYGPTLAAAAAQVGGRQPETAARRLARQAKTEVTGQIVGQEGDYLLLFAWFHHDLGNDERANTLLDDLLGRSLIHEAVLLDQLVNRWPDGQWKSRVKASAHRLRNIDETKRRLQAAPALFERELNHWLG